MKATPVERIAGLAFLAFTVAQVPFFLVDSDLVAHGIMPLSPLQVSAASLARQTPRAALYIQDVLTPGTWVREVLSPWLRCRLVNQDGRHPPSAKFAGRGSSAGCAAVIERGLLDVMAYVRNGTNLPLLVELLEERGLGRGQEAVVLGCTMVVVSAAFSVYYSVKTAVLGFVALAWGIYKSELVPLPPVILMAFLCVYAGFNLGEVRGQARDARRVAAAAAGGAVVRPLTPSSSSKLGGSGGKQAGSSPAKKQKQKQRRA